MKIKLGKCAKQTTMAIIITDSEMFYGFNWCENPQKTCPRDGMKTGEGYELCKTICKQRSHAEVDAIRQANGRAQGGTLFLHGHYYACEDCINEMKQAGIEGYVIVTDDGKYSHEHPVEKETTDKVRTNDKNGHFK